MLYFDKKLTHLEIVTRSKDLLKLMFSEKAMTHRQMLEVWGVAQSGDSILKALYTMFGELSNDL